MFNCINGLLQFTVEYMICKLEHLELREGRSVIAGQLTTLGVTVFT